MSLKRRNPGNPGNLGNLDKLIICTEFDHRKVKGDDEDPESVFQTHRREMRFIATCWFFNLKKERHLFR